ncbi:hypothetical protein AQS8620_02297 [Aquimixticola soesokkakensis]|uniref:Glutamine amidotransferase domain-containing protein n=1 Tax=Aquimixticola soesokkakensis TaxID=1519096 RepID=A0A1Y5T4Z6_9RHOB|nr:hypothetical protein [Aquimixticola soesokkakensis]SLN52420.1 hypothetical protein AQS8620_02297 [Aquimixticola soesokkakensis]
MTADLVFAPLVPWSLLAVAALVMAGVVALGLWRGLRGWWLRGLGALAVLAALAGPGVQREDRTPLSDIVVLVVDQSASQALSDRAAQIAQARAAVEAEIAAMPNTQLRVVTLGDGEENTGTQLMTRLAQAVAQEPRARLAGAILLTDGQLHDVAAAPDLPAPLHVLLTGHDTDWDRRLIVKNAPAFGIVEEEVSMVLRIEDQGATPFADGARTTVDISVDGGAPQRFTVPVGEDLDLPFVLPHGGMNVLQITVPTGAGELTDRNNSAVVQINAVRDRLRVLLVSGEPHAGERTWRNLLKSDSSVDLVHFTILRPPEKQDGVPVTELALIAFPTRELFMEKVDDFDLIIFDRYKRRGILPADYFANIARYVEEGGAVLFATGPDYATADSIYRSPLGAVIDARPTGQVVSEAFTPQITDLGDRHPVTQGLAQAFGTTEAGLPEWGRWLRQIDLTTQGGEVVMSGAQDKPLLVLDRVGEGRVAVLASDQAWLWSRGYDGGGPQLELLRRLAHWMMKEPELEEEALSATASGTRMTVTRRSLQEGARDVVIEAPDGSLVTLPMVEVAPGRFEAEFEGPEMGLYRLQQDDLEAVVVLGPDVPVEFEETIATGDKLAPRVEETRGGVLSVAAGLPDIRRVSQGRVAAGRGWIGITPRNAFVATDVRSGALLPAWLWLLLGAGLFVAGWLREGRH